MSTSILREFSCKIVSIFSISREHGMNTMVKCVKPSRMCGLTLMNRKWKGSMIHNIPLVIPADADVQFSTSRGFLRKFISHGIGKMTFTVRKQNGVIYIGVVNPPIIADINSIGLRFENVLCGEVENYDSRCHAIIKGNLSGLCFIYTAEIDALMKKDHKSVPVEIKTCREGKWTGIKQASAWLQCFLTNIKTIILGEYEISSDSYDFDKITEFDINDPVMMSRKNITGYIEGIATLRELLHNLMINCDRDVGYLYIYERFRNGSTIETKCERIVTA